MSYDSSEFIFNFSSFYASYPGIVCIYFDNVGFPCWVSIISLVLLKRLVNVTKDYFSSCFMLTTFLIALNIDAIRYRLSCSFCVIYFITLIIPIAYFLICVSQYFLACNLFCNPSVHCPKISSYALCIFVF